MSPLPSQPAFEALRIDGAASTEKERSAFLLPPCMFRNRENRGGNPIGKSQPRTGQARGPTTRSAPPALAAFASQISTQGRTRARTKPDNLLCSSDRTVRFACPEKALPFPVRVFCKTAKNRAPRREHTSTLGTTAHPDPHTIEWIDIRDTDSTYLIWPGGAGRGRGRAAAQSTESALHC